MVLIELPWVQQVLGNDLVFDSRPGLNRLILSKESKLRIMGTELTNLGLPMEYYRWLCGTEEQSRINVFKIPSARLAQGHEVLRRAREHGA